MQAIHRDLKTASLGVLLRLALTGLSFAMLWLDIAVFGTDILEVSFTEVTQELMLFACALLFWTAQGPSEACGFRALAGGFFACLLMRELDGLFDPISHSAWCWPFSLIALVCICFAFRPSVRANTLVAMAAFVRTPVFGTLSTGLGVLVFSRIFGMGSFWHLILNEGYARLAKTTVEESIELLTYSMWLAAAFEYFWLQRKSAVRQEEVAAAPAQVF